MHAVAFALTPAPAQHAHRLRPLTLALGTATSPLARPARPGRARVARSWLGETTSLRRDAWRARSLCHNTRFIVSAAKPVPPTSTARVAIVWFRGDDLRVTDHAALQQAIHDASDGAGAGHVVPLYCIDPRAFEPGPLNGLARTGPHRARFLLECLRDLRDRLRSLGSDLIVRSGRPEDEVPRLAEELRERMGPEGGCRVTVHCHKVVGTEEAAVESAVGAALRAAGHELKPQWGPSTLYHVHDLPFAIGQLPDVYTEFRKIVEKECEPRRPRAAPRALPPLPRPLLAASAAAGSIPDGVSAFGYQDSAAEFDPRAPLALRGGETAALERLDHYLFGSDAVATYKETRNGMLGPDYSTKFSPWLAFGCVSPRTIHTEIRRYESERVANDSTYWVLFELIWRDFFKFAGMRHGKRLFTKSGMRRARKGRRSREDDDEVFELWCRGLTGYPLVDANMRELNATGFMSNRGRQNVASFLVKDLHVDWRRGAEYFERQLIDYDPCSNWGNWQYVAGVGNDPREDRYFNVVKQVPWNELGVVEYT
eukprot:tig00021012_g17007.t1